MITSTTDKELQGDGQDAPLESFNMCKRASENVKSDYKYVSFQCKHADYTGRCCLDNCIYDREESPDTAHKQWVHCLICDDLLAVPPNQLDVPICQKCRSVLKQCMKLPFTCQKCGKSQSHISKFPFSRLCDECAQDLLWCDNCLHWSPIKTTELADFDLP